MGEFSKIPVVTSINLAGHLKSQNTVLRRGHREGCVARSAPLLFGEGQFHVGRRQFLGFFQADVRLVLQPKNGMSAGGAEMS